MLNIKRFLEGYETYMKGKFGFSELDKKIAAVERVVIAYAKEWVIADEYLPDVKREIHNVLVSDAEYTGTIEYIDSIRGEKETGIANESDWYTLIKPSQQGIKLSS